jgi:guanylate kinase
LNNPNVARMLILSGPSGAGKTTLANGLIDTHPEIEFAISHTTRQKRPGESDDVEYHFISEEEFKALVENGKMLETATVYGYHYGTSRQAVDHALNAGHRVLLDVDWQGSKHLMQLFPDAISIFIQPPGGQDAAQRLLDRHQDSELTIESRMAQYQEQISHREEFDYVITNDDLDETLKELIEIVDRPAVSID